MGTYTTAGNVSELLGIPTFTASTQPTLTQVETIISRKEDRIDQKLMHSWRENTITDLFVNLSFIDARNGARFDLPDYTIKTLATGSGDKLEVWDGTAYVDFLVSKTAGRADDFWLDEVLGVLYIKTGVQRTTKKPIRITYRTGETTVTGDIEDLATLMTAVDVLNSYPLVINFADDGNSQTNNQQQKIDIYKADIKDIFNSLANIGTF